MKNFSIAVILFIIGYMTVTTFGCKKTERQMPVMGNDNVSLPDVPRGRKPKPIRPPKDTIVTPPPITTGYACIYLDFDGEAFINSPWNNYADFTVQPSGLTATEINEVLVRTQNFYSAFNVTVTDQLSVFNAANNLKKIQVIVTPTHDFYFADTGTGITYNGSFLWADKYPCFVYPDRLFGVTEYIGDITTHEAGHAIGLGHQLTPEGYYAPGFIMGYPFSTPTPIFTDDEIAFIKSKLL